MPILLNEDSSNSFLSILENQMKRISSDHNATWIFYAITCYFKQDAAKKVAKSISSVLHKNLSGFHILIDKDEWFKECLDLDIFVEDICRITNLSANDVSFTPISPKPNKLFHAKSYSLIKSNSSILSNYEGFGIVTSANLTNAGLEKNIEIGQLMYDSNSLEDFFNIFWKLKNNYVLSEQDLAEEKEYQQAFNILSSGSFYHQWQQKHKIDLRFRLKFSEKEKKRRKNKTDEPERYLGFDSDQETESISKDPINIKSFFEQFPKPIPDNFLGRYSIDTLLGNWVPKTISDLIEEELNKMTDIYINILQNKLEKEIDEYLKELEDAVESFKRSEIIDWTEEDNVNAISRWKKRVMQISQDKNLLKLLLWQYEKIPISLDSIQERNFIFTLYKRLKEFYNPNINRQGVGQILSENNHGQINNDFFKDLVKEAEKKLETNRVGDLYKEDNQDKKFCALVKPSNQIINGVFIRLLCSKQISIFEEDRDKFVYKNNDEQKSCLIENLVTFKIINPKTNIRDR